MDFLNLKDLNAPFEDELVEAAERVIRSGRYLHGPETEALEAETAAVCGVRNCVAVSNGMDAIRLSLRALMETGRLRKGDGVLVPSNTFIASVLPISELGLTPILVETEFRALNMTPWTVRQRIEDVRKNEPYVKIRALMTVHLFGTPCWDASFMEELRQKGIWIIEDNAQAIGARAAAPGFNGTDRTGGLGHIAATSFYPTKNVGALGDAGCVTTDDPELARMVRTLANYGSLRRYENILPGYNNRMDEIQAAMLRVKLRHVDELNEERRQAAAAYSESLDRDRFIIPQTYPEMRQVWHQYVVRVTARKDFLRKALEAGIPTDIHYPIPPHRQRCYLNTLGKERYPETEKMTEGIVSLPIANLSPDEARKVAEVLNGCAVEI